MRRPYAPGSPSELEKVERIFKAALDMPPCDRGPFLAEACEGNTDFRAYVERLLSHHDERMGTFLEQPLLQREDRLETKAVSALPERIGQYEIIRVIGEGGMGVVYEARQAQPQRRVALKVIRAAFASRQLLRRFEREAEVLGRLQHPGIAHIYEAGTAEIKSAFARPTRQPFFAMEYIEGQPLTRYAREKTLGTRERLELIAKVCDAVQHAHQKGVIHRDLKPANILVDAAGRPRILDFGVARVTDADVHTVTLQTTVGQIIGTLAYMSPEQVTGDPGQLDTRSDVYALGVILYELMTGRLPYDCTGCAIPEAARKIRDEQPEPMSSINRALRGEIETIAATALEKNKIRRYQSASDLASDLRRYLCGEPIEAKRDSALYVLRKTLRRYRGLATAAVLFVVLLAAFGVISFLQAKKNERLAEDERQARTRADETAGLLAVELSANNIERGRLLGMTGNIRMAEDLIWRAYLRDPDSAHAHWALWELYMRQPCLLSMGGHTDYIHGVAFHPAGKLVASCSKDRTIKLWDVASGRCIATAIGHDSDVLAVEFAPDGRTLVSGSFDGTVKLWDTDSMRCIATMRHGGRVWSVDFSPDGSLFASSGEDSALRVWDSAIHRCLVTLPAHEGRVLEVVRFRPGGRMLASTGEDRSVKLWELSFKEGRPVSGRCALTLTGHSDIVTSLAFSAEGDLLASGGPDGTVRLWDVETGECRATLTPRIGTVRKLAFSAGSQMLAVGGWTSVDLWDVGAFRRIEAYKVQNSVTGLAFSPDGRFVCVGEGSFSIQVRLWETSPNRCLKAVQVHNGRNYMISVSPDGRTVASGGQDGLVRLWDIATRRQVASFSGHRGHVGAVRFSPDGALLASASYDGLIKLWNPATGSCLATMSGFSTAGAPLVFVPDSSPPQLLSGCQDGKITRWKNPTGRQLGTVMVSPREVTRICLSPDGRLLATAARTTSVRLLNAKTYEPLAALPTVNGHTPWCLAISPDSRTLAVGTWGDQIELWDLPSQQRTAVLEDHNGLIRCVAFHPDAGIHMLASASADGTIKLWHTVLRHCLATLEAKAGDVYAVAFVPAQSGPGMLLSAHADGTLGFWDLTYYDRHIAGNLTHQFERLASELGEAGRVDRLKLEEKLGFAAVHGSLLPDADAAGIAPGGS